MEVFTDHWHGDEHPDWILLCQWLGDYDYNRLVARPEPWLLVVKAADREGARHVMHWHLDDALDKLWGAS